MRRCSRRRDAAAADPPPLFTCYPGFGHLHPMLPLARAALRAGHEVAFATGPDLAPRAVSYGFHAWPVGLSSGETVERYLARHPDSNDLPPAERLRKVAGARRRPTTRSPR